MRIMMTPGLCSNQHRSTGGTFCESCFASFLNHGCEPDRPCITDVVDDGCAETTIVLRYGEQRKTLTVTDENRDALAYGGWHGWVQFAEKLSNESRSQEPEVRGQ
jgi:hypothetical protein